MHSWRHALVATLISAGFVGLHAQTEKPAVSLFDGKTLAGWTLEGGAAPSTVFVEGGAIRLSQPGGGAMRGWLRSAREYGDFVFRFDYRVLNDAALSGIYIRSVPTSGFNNAWPEAAYQIQIREFASDDRLAGAAQAAGQPKPVWAGAPISGALMSQPKTDPPAAVIRFDDAAVRAIQRNIGDWYTMEIEARGRDVRVRLNGTVVTEGTIPRLSGYIGVQLERSGVEFRNLSVRELTPEK